MVEGRELVRCSLESTGWSSVKDSAAVGRKAGRVSLGPVGRAWSTQPEACCIRSRVARFNK